MKYGESLGACFGHTVLEMEVNICGENKGKEIEWLLGFYVLWLGGRYHLLRGKTERADQGGKDEFSFWHTEFDITISQWRYIISVAVNKFSYYRVKTHIDCT